jgi:hypothetical protein
MSDQNLPSAIQKVELVDTNENADDKAKTPVEQFVDHQRKAIEETGKALESLLPEGFREHGKAAGKEFFKGVKVLVDAAANEVEKAGRELEKQFRTRQRAAQQGEGDEERPSSTGTTKVKVQVE